MWKYIHPEWSRFYLEKNLGMRGSLNLKTGWVKNDQITLGCVEVVLIFRVMFIFEVFFKLKVFLGWVKGGGSYLLRVGLGGEHN